MMTKKGNHLAIALTAIVALIVGGSMMTSANADTLDGGRFCIVASSEDGKFTKASGGKCENSTPPEQEVCDASLLPEGFYLVEGEEWVSADCNPAAANIDRYNYAVNFVLEGDWGDYFDYKDDGDFGIILAEPRDAIMITGVTNISEAVDRKGAASWMHHTFKKSPKEFTIEARFSTIDRVDEGAWSMPATNIKLPSTSFEVAGGRTNATGGTDREMSATVAIHPDGTMTAR